MIETVFWIIGTLGSAAFAINLLPQVLKAYHTKSTKDISRTFLYFAYVGNICSFTFVLYSNICSGFWQYPLYFNYTIATILTLILHILKRKYDK